MVIVIIIQSPNDLNGLICIETLKLTHKVLLKEHEHKLVRSKESREEVVIPAMKLPQLKIVQPSPSINLLHTVTQQTLDKMNAADVRVLNKKLKRTLDMTDLSEMSNTMLSRILDDLEHFNQPFNNNTEIFFLVQLICQMLKEMCTMKTTLNDLQADFVRRIKASSSLPSMPIILYEKPSWIQSIITFCSFT